MSTIQDETHRYAIAYAHHSHTKKSLELSLTRAPGIGPARAKALLAQFKTLNAIKSASVEELAAIKGMTRASAQALREYLDNEA